MTVGEAVLYLRQDPKYSQLILDSYLDADPCTASRRFLESDEFAEVQRLLLGRIAGATIVDLGAGTGIASYSFARLGARRVYAVEPDLAESVGAKSILSQGEHKAIDVVGAVGEAIPLGGGCVDIVYARQVLHHANDLRLMLRECSRILKPGGVFLACREHVVDDEKQLQTFREGHPVHRLAGGENAHRLDTYRNAIVDAGLTIDKTMGPYDSIINAFPLVRRQDELRHFARVVITSRLGRWGGRVAELPLAGLLVHQALRRRRTPGRMYSFLARKS